MRVIKDGVMYELESTDKSVQILMFIHKDKDSGDIVQGTTTEEIIAMLIDRIETLNVKNKSSENDTAIRNLEIALREIKKRNKNKSDKKFKFKSSQNFKLKTDESDTVEDKAEEW